MDDKHLHKYTVESLFKRQEYVLARPREIIKLKMFVPGDIASKGSLVNRVFPKVTEDGKYTIQVASFPQNAKALRKYTKAIRDIAEQELTNVNDEMYKLIQSLAWKVHLTFYFNRPKSHLRDKFHDYSSVRPKCIYLKHAVKPDIDKITRAVLDALTGVLWENDSRVYAIFAEKRYANSYDEQGTRIIAVGVRND
ncbi:MAG: hypothetical protein KatS3mg087_1017 [Patescibacteria group bacterium]|nr:MAG: hypothetical protein KatS3mg087_1017 [Patescibacteria group bacterium]